MAQFLAPVPASASASGGFNDLRQQPVALSPEDQNILNGLKQAQKLVEVVSAATGNAGSDLSIGEIVLYASIAGVFCILFYQIVRISNKLARSYIV